MLTHQNTAIKACLKAGKAILEVYNSADAQVEYKADDSPLTLADRLAHQAIQKELEPTGIPILSEEGKHFDFGQRKEWNELWIVDPLDGTKEFIKRNGEFTVNIARVVNGETVEGYIYVPVTDELYYGEVGKGSFLQKNASKNGAVEELPIHSHDKMVVVASRSHLSEETKEFVASLEQELEKVEMRSIGSSLKLCLIATGEATLYPRFAPTMEWDIAAGHAIIKGAGRNVYWHSSGKEMNYNRENLRNDWFLAK